MSYSEEDFDEKYEEYYRRYEEEEGPYVEGGLLSNENDYLYVPSYEEFMIPISIHDGFTCRGRSKESVVYLAYYCGLSDGIRKVLYFQEYFTLDIQNLFIYPYCRKNMKRIAHMVDEVFKEVETKRLSLGAKIEGKNEDSSKPSSFPSNKRMFVFFPNITSNDHLDEEEKSRKCKDP